MFVELNAVGTNHKDFNKARRITINVSEIKYIIETDEGSAMIYMDSNFGYETEQTYQLVLSYLKAVDSVFTPERKIQ